jgi:hypothetical protein
MVLALVRKKEYSYVNSMNLCNSLATPTAYGLGGRVSIPAKEGNYLHISIRTGSRFHPETYPMFTGCSLPRAKGPDLETNF